MLKNHGGWMKRIDEDTFIDMLRETDDWVVTSANCIRQRTQPGFFGKGCPLAHLSVGVLGMDEDKSEYVMERHQLRRILAAADKRPDFDYNTDSTIGYDIGLRERLLEACGLN